MPDERAQRAPADRGERLRAEAVEELAPWLHPSSVGPAAATIPSHARRERHPRAPAPRGPRGGRRTAGGRRLSPLRPHRRARSPRQRAPDRDPRRALAEDANCVDIGAHTGGVLRDIIALRSAGAATWPSSRCQSSRRRSPASSQAWTSTTPRCPTRPASRSSRSASRSRCAAASSRPAASRRPPATSTSCASRTERLDDVLPADYVPALIKIDVEGAETAVFRGAIETLRRHKPIIVFDTVSGARTATDPARPRSGSCSPRTSGCGSTTSTAAGPTRARSS